MPVEKGRFKEFESVNRERFFFYWGTKDGLKGYYKTDQEAFDTLKAFPALAELRVGASPDDWEFFKGGFWQGQQDRFAVERKQERMDAQIKALLAEIEIK